MIRKAFACLALALAACGQADAPVQPVASEAAANPPAPTAPATPDLAACDAAHELDEGAGGNVQPIDVPATIRDIAAASPHELAILTRAGATVCINLSWIYGINDAEWLADDRLLGFATHGFEAFGYLVIDRQGRGTQTETGDRPVFSPSGMRFAAVQVSDSEWGGLEGFAVWDVTPDGVREVGRDATDWNAPNPPVYPAVFMEHPGEWAITRWHGEGCVGLAMTPYVQGPKAPPPAVRPFHAREADGWKVTPGPCP